jgi:hypothetical protein
MVNGTISYITQYTLPSPNLTMSLNSTFIIYNYTSGGRYYVYQQNILTGVGSFLSNTGFVAWYINAVLADDNFAYWVMNQNGGNNLAYESKLSTAITSSPGGQYINYSGGANATVARSACQSNKWLITYQGNPGNYLGAYYKGSFPTTICSTVTLLAFNLSCDDDFIYSYNSSSSIITVMQLYIRNSNTVVASPTFQINVNNFFPGISVSGVLNIDYVYTANSLFIFTPNYLFIVKVNLDQTVTVIAYYSYPNSITITDGIVPQNLPYINNTTYIPIFVYDTTTINTFDIPNNLYEILIPYFGYFPLNNSLSIFTTVSIVDLINIVNQNVSINLYLSFTGILNYNKGFFIGIYCLTNTKMYILQFSSITPEFLLTDVVLY